MTKTAFYNNPRFRSAFYQLVVLAAVVWFGVEFVINARANLEAQNLRFGLRLSRRSGGLQHQPVADPLQRAGQLRAASSSSACSTRCWCRGSASCSRPSWASSIGLARLSPNWLLARLAGGYVELIRNLPLLFQILFWYLAVLLSLPGTAPEHRDRTAAAAAVRGGWVRLPGALRRARLIAQWWRSAGRMDRTAGGLSEQSRRDHAARDLRRGQRDRRGGIRDRDRWP